MSNGPNPPEEVDVDTTTGAVITPTESTVKVEEKTTSKIDVVKTTSGLLIVEPRPKCYGSWPELKHRN